MVSKFARAYVRNGNKAAICELIEQAWGTKVAFVTATV